MSRTAKPAAAVVVGDRVWVRVLERFAAVTAIVPTGYKMMGTDVPMLRLELGPEARPAKAMELPESQTVEVAS